MDWCRLSTQYYLDAALLRAGEPAEVLFLRCLAYSGAKESRGLIPRHVLPMLTPTRTKSRVDALIREGLLVAQGEHDVLIRSWDRWQEALDIEAERRRKDRERKARERAEARGASDGQSTDSPRTVRVNSSRKEVEVEKEKDQQTSSVGGTRKRAHPAPAAFELTDDHRTWLTEHAPLITNPASETALFLDHHRAKGSRMQDWPAAWRTWMRNAQKYAAERQQRQPPTRAGAVRFDAAAQDYTNVRI